MTLHEYFKTLKKKQRITFFELIRGKCRVKDSTIYSWVALPTANNYREPRGGYKAMISEALGMPEEDLFVASPEDQLPKF